ncbi:MAG: toluene-4-monooxygenase system B family protein [Sporichthyaceae bacterium]
MSTAVEIPVQALFQGDFLTFLVVFESTDTVDQACEKVAEGVVGRRFPPRDGGYEMRLEDGTLLAPDAVLADVGLEPEDYVVVSFRNGA